MEEEAKKAHYRLKYGNWAGNQSGHRPDYSRCCEEVWPNERGPIPHQCRRKAGFGPGGAYCKQHDPAFVKARAAAANAKDAARRRAERPKWYAREMLEALRQIADGHNDPRTLAAEIVKKVDG